MTQPYTPNLYEVEIADQQGRNRHTVVLDYPDVVALQAMGWHTRYVLDDPEKDAIDNDNYWSIYGLEKNNSTVDAN